MVLGTLLYVIIIIVVVIVIIALLQILVGLFFIAPALAEINLDADLMTIYPDPGKPITILEDNSAGITATAK